MQHLEEYVNWLKVENQALYDLTVKQYKEIQNLRKKIMKYECQEKLFNEVESLKKKADSYDRLLEFINDCKGILDA